MQVFRRWSSSASSFAASARDSSHKFQIYTSRSQDPFLNLSIEHFLLQNSPHDSTILYLYVNSPCVVIGRNQNPWLEADLKLLRQTQLAEGEGKLQARQSHVVNKCIPIVRRRTGGGAVFHDEGNINYSVICPTAAFHRDRHVEMVVRAIRQYNPRARVNERHDIVLDQGMHHASDRQLDSSDMHKTAYEDETGDKPPLKVSGSAYKLTRQRSLHHGTCLLASPNIERLSQYLRSPGRAFIKARGVESVRSPVANILSRPASPVNLTVHAFQGQIVKRFSELYDIKINLDDDLAESAELCSVGNCVAGCLDVSVAELPEIQSGILEMKSPAWIYGQTPQFTVSSEPYEEDRRERPPLPKELGVSTRVFLRIRSGVITSSEVSFSANPTVAIEEASTFCELLQDKNLYKTRTFADILDVKSSSSTRTAALVQWLDKIFGK